MICEGMYVHMYMYDVSITCIFISCTCFSKSSFWASSNAFTSSSLTVGGEYSKSSKMPEIFSQNIMLVISWYILRRREGSFICIPFSIKSVVSSGMSLSGSPSWAFCLGCEGKAPINPPTMRHLSLRYATSAEYQRTLAPHLTRQYHANTYTYHGNPKWQHVSPGQMHAPFWSH